MVGAIARRVRLEPSACQSSDRFNPGTDARLTVDVVDFGLHYRGPWRNGPGILMLVADYATARASMADYFQSSDGEERSAEGTRAGDAPLIEILRSIPHLNAVLDRTEPQILRDVELMLGYIGLPAGTILFAEGDAAEDAYVLVSGRVGVFVGTEPGAAPIAQIAAGEIVGEMSLISDEPRSATVIALRDSDLIRVPRVAFGLLFQGSPQASFLLMRYLVTRLSAASHAQLRTPDVETLALVQLFAHHSGRWFIGDLI